jgi:mycothiol synthase
MADESFIIRNYCSADLLPYVRFHADAESVCHSDDTLFLASLTGESLQPADFSEEDLFLAEKQGKIVGACRVIPEIAIERAVLRLLLMPGLVNQEITATLIRAALKRAGNLKAAKVHADLREKDQTARDLLAGLGFRPVRRYSVLTLDLSAEGKMLHISLTSGDLSLRSLPRGREAEFTDLQNRVFEDSWGFCPNTTSQILRLLNTPGCGHDGVIMAYKGNSAVGYCWTARILRPDRDAGATSGRIHMMGVAPEHRGRGLGRLILQAGLKHLSNSGVQTVELTADNENTAACSLYASAGFKLKNALVWYEKKIR